MIRVITPGYEHLTANNITCKASIEADWQCLEVPHHVWGQRIDRRVAHPNCPYCTGQRVHEKDALYGDLVESSALRFLHPEDVEASKRLLPGGNSKLRFACRECGEFKPRTWLHFSKIKVCKNCKGERQAETRKNNAIKKHGSVADHPHLLQQYCWDQPELQKPEKKQYRNPLLPEEVPATWGKNVYWMCSKGHITKATPRHRYDGRRCGKCSPALSQLEALLFFELKHLLKPLGYTVSHRELIYGNEADISVVGQYGQNFAIEVDGRFFHLPRKKQDTAKNQAFQNAGYKTVRVREKGLPTLPRTDLQIEYSPDDLRNPDPLNDVLRFIRGESHVAVEVYTQRQDAEAYYIECQQVSFEDSADHRHPHLVEELDISKTSLRLEHLTPGFSMPLPWICKHCGYPWEASLAKRCGTGNQKGTNCPSCSNQVVTEHNCLAATHPEVGKCTDEAETVVSGSTNYRTFKCDYPGCTTSRKRMVRDVVKQYEKQGHNWLRECNHEGHRRPWSEETRKKHAEKLSLRAEGYRQRDWVEQLGEAEWEALDPELKQALMAPRHKGVRCPKCQQPNMKGSSLKEKADSLRRHGGLLCGFCLNSGIPITHDGYSAGTVLQNLDKAKCILADLTIRGWKIDPTKNDLGLSFTDSSLSISAISTPGHECTFTLSEWRIRLTDSEASCFCETCGEQSLLTKLMERGWRINTSIKPGHGLSATSSLGHECTFNMKQWVRKLSENDKTCFCGACSDPLMSILKPVYPNFEILGPLDDESKLSVCRCGGQTEINGVLIKHPPFTVNRQKIEKSLAKCMHACPACAIDSGSPPASTRKLLGLPNYRWKRNAAFLGCPVPPDVQTLNGETNPCLPIKTSGTGNELRFPCGNPEHTAVETTYDNAFNKAKKGYCPECLRERGVGSVAELDD